jgi:hypothetical protein
MANFITNKVTGQTVSAPEWNQLNEINNILLTAGITPSDAVTTQLANAVARYSAGSTFYTDSGSANTYILTSSNGFSTPVLSGAGYFDGMQVRFRAGYTNTGASTININSFGSKLIKKNNFTALTGGEINNSSDVILRYCANNDCFVLNVNTATKQNIGFSYLNNPIQVVNNVASPNDTIDFGAGTYITSTGNQIYLPAITKKIQLSGFWTAGTNQNGLDTGVRSINTFYRTYIIQNNSTLAYDILFAKSGSSPTIPSGYTNLGLLDYALIRVNGSNNIAGAKWDANNKQLVLGPSEIIQVFSSLAGSGSAQVLITTEPLEMQIRVSLVTGGAGASDILVWGSEHNENDSSDTVQATTNNGFSNAVGFSPIYTSNGTIYWKNFSTAGGILNQTCKLKSIKIRS